ncbi:MAG: aldo/keto reductase [Propionibacteriaceae bacterium]|jgi:predicted oxidoreductase|nr:aldo/keto reductase [Propionibacteriaceae bacterium]
MRTTTLASTGLTPSAVVLGMMRIADKSDDEIRALVRAGIESGVNHIDHADIYGHVEHQCEERFATALNLTPSERDGLIIQSKCGINAAGNYFDFSAERIIGQVEGSLQALRTDRLDLLLLHRPDALVEPEEVARAFDTLEQQGKVRYFGVSNHTPGQIELLKTAVRQPLVVNQMQHSIAHASLVAAGLAPNMESLPQSVDRDNDTINYCRMANVTLQAWSPFQAGFFQGSFLGDYDRYGALNGVIDRLANSYGVAPVSIATAWILRHPASWQVVLGTTTPDRVRDACRGADITLTRPEWYELLKAAGYTIP